MRFGMLALATAAVSQPAKAATIVQTGSFTNIDVGIIHKLSSAMGTLVSVKIEQTLFAAAGQEYYQAFPGTSIYSTNFNGNVGTMFGSLFFDVNGSGSQTYGEGPFYVQGFFTGNTLRTLYSPFDDLSFFAGDGDIVFGMTGSPFSLSAGASSGPPIFPATDSRPFVGASVDYRVTFNFDDGLPEPATWLSMIIGFGLIGVSMRNRRSSSAVALA